MRASEVTRPTRNAERIALLLIIVASALLAQMFYRASRNPSTDAATIDGEVVHVAAEVGGRLTELNVAENASVRRGDVLFRIDPAPYVHAAAQAEAELRLAQAALAAQQRTIIRQQATAAVATEQARKARSLAGLTQLTVARLRPLAQDGYVPQQQLDQAVLGARDALGSQAQTQREQAALAQAVDTPDGTLAMVASRRAALAIALRALQQTTVRAPHDGRVVGLSVTTGEVLAPSQPLFTLIAAEPWFASGNFRETVLKHIRIGECATVYSMIDRSSPMRGHVVGIGAGVLDGEKVEVPRNVPYVERSLNWVRVSQRFPVRVMLDAPPERLLRLGASAVIEVGHGSACQ